MINIEMSKVYDSSPKKVWSVWATMGRWWQGLLTQGRQIAPNNAIPWISNTINKWKRLEMDPQRRSSSLSRGKSRQSSRKTFRISLIINPWIVCLIRRLNIAWNFTTKKRSMKNLRITWCCDHFRHPGNKLLNCYGFFFSINWYQLPSRENNAHFNKE
jgi:hypothetical protein